MTTRVTAVRALGRILRGGAWSNVVLRPGGDQDDRVVAALVLDALRTHGLADEVLGEASGRPLGRIQDDVLDVLRIAIGELDRATTPPEVIVSATVDATRALGHERATGFVNGVLRSVVRSGIPDRSPVERLGVPPWLDRQLAEAWGNEEATRFWEASSHPARVGLHDPLGEADGAEPVPGIPGAVLASRPVPGLQVLDPASLAVALSVDAQPGERILDMAAAPGGKTAVLLRSVGASGLVVGADSHVRRTRSASRRLPGALWVRADGTLPPFAAKSFDRVLLDAPCTGLGTLRRRPEILRRVTEAEVERLASLQRRLIESASELVRPGGRFVFSVCTVTPAETVSQLVGDWRPPEIAAGTTWGRGRLLGPHVGPTDGMFIGVLDL